MASNTSIYTYEDSTGKKYHIQGPAGQPPTDDVIEEMIAANAPAPSIEERVLANALYTGDNAGRSSWLKAQGKSPVEPGQWYREPGILPKLRELTADVAETGIAQGGKALAQTQGESLGSSSGAALGAMVGNPATAITGGTAGFIAGGGAARSAAQKFFEEYASATKRPIDSSRVRQEFATGSLTSAAGKLLGVTGQGFKKTAAGKALEKFYLTNVTRIPSMMQGWAHNRWTQVTNLAKTQEEAYGKFHDLASKTFSKLFKKKDDIGESLNAIRYSKMFEDPIKPPMPGLVEETKALTKDFLGSMKITTDMADDLLYTAQTLENLGGKNLSALPSREAVKAIRAAAKANKEPAPEGLIAREDAEALYRDAYNNFVNFGAKGEKDPGKATGALSYAFKKLVTKNLPEAAEESAKYQELALQLDHIGSMFKEDSIVTDKAKMDSAVKFIADHIFDEKSIGFDKAFAKVIEQHAGKETLHTLMDLVTAYTLRDPNIVTAGVKTGYPSIIGGAAGGLIGYAASGGDWKAAGKGAGIGSGLGLASSIPFMVPGMATNMYRALEAVGRSVPGKVGKWVGRKAAPYIPHSPKIMSSPAGAAIRALLGQFETSSNEGSRAQ